MIDKNFPLYVAVFAIAFILTVLIERALLPGLKKIAEQPIYTEGPSWHAKKNGTPTMGGLAFLASITVTLTVAFIYLLSNGLLTQALSLMTCIVFSILNSAIGIIDDLSKLRHRHNKGLSPRGKLVLQSIASIVFLAMREFLIGRQSVIVFSFGEVDLGFLYYPIAFLILVGITNCANLTDGIDGLASGVTFAIGVSLFYISCALSYEVSAISSAMMGAASAFLIFNIHPAKIFMGDTGSLFLGAIAASASIALSNPLLILLIGGIYVIEGASVILQVLCFKLTGKRIFKMAPMHHHLEKIGWNENRICIVAMILTFIFTVPAYVIYLP